MVEITAGAMMVAGGTFTAAKVFGPTLDAIGTDLSKAYAKGVALLVSKATAKVANADDGQQVNLRVARDVLWNGGLSEDEVCAEYFGGILASARSPDGKSDAVLHFVDTIKSMSSKQLLLHYLIYGALQRRLNADRPDLNIALGSELAAEEVAIFGSEAARRGIDTGPDLSVLHRVGVIGNYGYGSADVVSSGANDDPKQVMPFIKVACTTFGVMLYAVAFNRFADWSRFAREDFGSFEQIAHLEKWAKSPAQLASLIGVKIAP